MELTLLKLSALDLQLRPGARRKDPESIVATFVADDGQCFEMELSHVQCYGLGSALREYSGVVNDH